MDSISDFDFVQVICTKEQAVYFADIEGHWLSEHFKASLIRRTVASRWEWALKEPNRSCI